MFQFDGENRLIILDPGVLSFNVIDLYSRWKEWVQIGDNSKWIPAFSNSIGGNTLGGGVSLSGYFFIINGWQIRPQETDHELIVVGDLYPFPDTANIFTQTLGEFTVPILLQRSSATQVAQCESPTNSPVQISNQEEILEGLIQDSDFLEGSILENDQLIFGFIQESNDIIQGFLQDNDSIIGHLYSDYNMLEGSIIEEKENLAGEIYC